MTVREHMDEVSEALRAVSAQLADDGDLDAVLQALAERVVRVVPDTDMASVTVLVDGQPQTRGNSDRRVYELDMDQYAAGNGPCLEAARTQQVVSVTMETAQDRWPEFAAAACRAGVGSYLAAPLLLDAQTAGSFNLYSDEKHAFGRLDEALLEVFTSASVAALSQAKRYLAARETIGHLHTALESRSDIDQAKGALMAIHGITAEQAFEQLVQVSQQRNMKLRELVAEFLSSLRST